MTFCEDTKCDLVEILKQWTQIVDVKLLLQILQITMEFEGMLDMYAKGKQSISHLEGSKQESALGEPLGIHIDDMSIKNPFSEETTSLSTVDTMKMKYDYLRKQDDKHVEPPVKEEPQKEGSQCVFIGSISSCFEPYLTYFVEAEDR
jgi:hypothetical protein